MVQTGLFFLVEAIYRDNRMLNRAHALLADLCASLGHCGAARFIELGAGTGSATAAVLARLQPMQTTTEYRFTDVGQAFVQRAARNLAARYDFVRTSLLDLTRDTVDQGIDADGYDVAIAANVLHALPDIAEGLARANRLLKTGGRLVVIELVEVLAFNTATFGLLPDWWAARDPALRQPDSPLLTTQAWRLALERSGFADIVITQTNRAIALISARKAGAAQLPQALPAGPAVHAAAPSAGGRVAPPRAAIAQRVHAVIATVLRMPVEQIDARSAFSDLGVDSILAGEAAQRLAQEFGIEVKPTVLFNHPNPAALSAWIEAMTPVQSAPLPGAAPEPVADDALMSLLQRMEGGEADIELAEQEIRRIHD